MDKRNELSSRIRHFVLSRFPRARQRSVTDEDSLLGGGIVDSMGIVELLSFVETEFKVLISDDDLNPENFQSIQRITAFVETKLRTE